MKDKERFKRVDYTMLDYAPKERCYRDWRGLAWCVVVVSLIAAGFFIFEYDINWSDFHG